MVAAVLTTISLAPVDNAPARVPASVGQVFANGSFKKSLAALAAKFTILFILFVCLLYV